MVADLSSNQLSGTLDEFAKEVGGNSGGIMRFFSLANNTLSGE